MPTPADFPAVSIVAGCGGMLVWLWDSMPLSVWADGFGCHGWQMLFGVDTNAFC